MDVQIFIGITSLDQHSMMGTRNSVGITQEVLQLKFCHEFIYNCSKVKLVYLYYLDNHGALYRLYLRTEKINVQINRFIKNYRCTQSRIK